MVLEDFGDHGCAYRETDIARADLESVIGDLLRGEFHRPLQVIGFNLSEGWVRDVSSDIANEVSARAANSEHNLPTGTLEFLERVSSSETHFIATRA